MRLRLGPVELLQAFAAQKLHWSNNMLGLEWWGDLDVEQLTKANCVDWDQTTVSPTGLRFQSVFQA